MGRSTTEKKGLEGLEVVAFESRRAKEMAALISRYGGTPVVAPAMREIPLEENSAAFQFADELFAGKIDGVIFLTGVGTRTLFEALETRFPRPKIVSTLSEITVVARGPKPLKVLREYQIPVTITVPEPNTWREILQELDENPRGFTLRGSRVAVQEYGISNEAFLRELADRGVSPLRVPVYRWALPEDTGPLGSALEAISEGRARVVLFTNAGQVDHMLQFASKLGLRESLSNALGKCVVCSVGPTSSEVLRAKGLPVDLEPEHPKMGVLVQECAKRVRELLQKKGNNPDSRVALQEPLSEKPKAPEGDLLADSRFMKACRREPVDATPVWLMRQAGRYMKEYRDLRARVPFLELCKSPELVCEVTVAAARRIGADAAIIFADLLLIVEPLGYDLAYDAGEGPLVRPVLRESAHVDRMREVEPEDSLRYLYEAIRLTRSELPPDIPLLGFAGAPFTLASYIIEGGASKNYVHTKSLMYRDPGAWHALMEHLSRSLVKYTNAQIAAGVQAVQIFDTWVGCLGQGDYRRFVLPHTRSLIQGITPGAPVIHFGTGTAHLLEDMRDAGGEVIGLDFRVELDQAWARLGTDVAVQGNLDPLVLFAEPPTIRERTQEILDKAAGRPGHVFNLGHGILPQTPVDNVLRLIEFVHELSSRMR